MGLIYKIACDINGKCYVGQTRRSLDKRIREHLKDSKRKSMCLFHKAIRKHGWKHFTVEVLEDNIPLENLNERELYYTEKFKALAPNGYVLKAGEYNQIFSKEIKEQMSFSHKGNKNFNFKRNFSLETRRKMSQSRKNKFLGSKNHLSKTILCYDLNDNFIKEYGSLREAERELNLNHSHISAVCLKKRKRVGNYKFKYKEEQ